MRSFRRARGASNIGCIIGLILLVAVGYVAYQFISVKIRISQFHDALEEQAQFASIKPEKRIIDDVVDKAQELRIPVTKENLKVRKTSSTFTLETHYELPVVFPGYTYIWKVDEVVERPLFST